MTRFHRGFYRHNQFKDVFIEIIKSQYQDAKRFKGRVRWWNLGFTGNPWILFPNEPIEINRKDMNDWKPYSFDAILELSQNRGKND